MSAKLAIPVRSDPTAVRESPTRRSPSPGVPPNLQAVERGPEGDISCSFEEIASGPAAIVSLQDSGEHDGIPEAEGGGEPLIQLLPPQVEGSPAVAGTRGWLVLVR